jgi:hypothetical protein
VKWERGDMERMALPTVLFATMRGELMSWVQRFFDPIRLPGRKSLVTLRDAAHHQIAESRTRIATVGNPIEWLMLVGEHGGDPMVPRIAMMKASLRHEPKAASAPRNLMLASIQSDTTRCAAACAVFSPLTS